jgi:low affinity Fe/Cu permease
MQDLFHRFAQRTSVAVGSGWAFAAALGAIVIWALIGPAVGFTNTWQLVINTGTTIVTFLIVFLIQNTQNRESRAIQLKLDELIIASTAGNEAVDLENISDKGATELLKQFHELAKRIQAR